MFFFAIQNLKYIFKVADFGDIALCLKEHKVV